MWEDLQKDTSFGDLQSGSKSWNEFVLRRLGFEDSELTLATVPEVFSNALRPGDQIRALNDQPVNGFYSLNQLLTANRKSTVSISISRGGQTLKKEVELVPTDVQRPEGKVTIYRFPVSFFGMAEYPKPFVQTYDSFFGALGYGIRTTANQSWVLVEAIAGLFSGDVPLQSLGGPIMIAQVAGKSAELGWKTFVTSLALISINLGIINLFPIPILDGGQLCMVAVEWIRRRPLSEVAMENYQKVGFVMVLALAIMATYNDVSRFWSSMIAGLMELVK